MTHDGNAKSCNQLQQFATTKEIVQALSISESKWKRDVKAGIYPPPQDFGGGCKRWNIAELNKCLESFPKVHPRNPRS